MVLLNGIGYRSVIVFNTDTFLLSLIIDILHKEINRPTAPTCHFFSHNMEDQDYLFIVE